MHCNGKGLLFNLSVFMAYAHEPSYVYVVRTLEVVNTSEKLKKKYQQAEGKKAAVQKIITCNKNTLRKYKCPHYT